MSNGLSIERGLYWNFTVYLVHELTICLIDMSYWNSKACIWMRTHVNMSAFTMTQFRDTVAKTTSAPYMRLADTNITCLLNPTCNWYTIHYTYTIHYNSTACERQTRVGNREREPLGGCWSICLWVRTSRSILQPKQVFCWLMSSLLSVHVHIKGLIC